MASRLTHIDETGAANMVDVSPKAVTSRSATAAGSISMNRETFDLAVSGGAKKGDVFAAARLAGIMAAKRTSDLIPLCHPLTISKVSVDIEPRAAEARIDVSATVKLDGKTGVEMEALTAVSVALLTLYDMLKASDKAMRISDIRLQEKTGGKSGAYHAK